MTKQAQIIFNKVWNEIPESNPEVVKEICLKTISYMENISLDFMSTPLDCIEYMKRCRILKKEIDNLYRDIQNIEI